MRFIWYALALCFFINILSACGNGSQAPGTATIPPPAETTAHQVPDTVEDGTKTAPPADTVLNIMEKRK